MGMVTRGLLIRRKGPTDSHREIENGDDHLPLKDIDTGQDTSYEVSLLMVG